MNFFRYSFFVLFLLFSCSDKKQPPANKPESAYFTCSMHPQVHLEKPGDCPVCGMHLIKVEKVITAKSSPDTGMLVLSPLQIKLGGIRTAVVKTGEGERIAQLNGTVRTDESQSEVISSRVSGRITQLYMNSTGRKITAGIPLYSVYSEDLRLAEGEYLLAVEQLTHAETSFIDYNALVAAARNKLFLWGLTKGQLASIRHRGTVSFSETILSPVQGIVSEVLVHQGDYISEGSVILKTQHLSNLWVEAQVYASEPAFAPGDQATLFFPDLPDEKSTGQISFIQPEIAESSAVNLIRIPILNKNGNIKPGMQAQVNITLKNKNSLTVSSSCVIYDGKASYVWLEMEPGKYVKREVKTTLGKASEIPVIYGLMPGDRIVIEGTYLLNSEAILKNVNLPKGMDPNMKM